MFYNGSERYVLAYCLIGTWVDFNIFQDFLPRMNLKHIDFCIVTIYDVDTDIFVEDEVDEELQHGEDEEGDKDFSQQPGCIVVGDNLLWKHSDGSLQDSVSFPDIES